MNKCIALIILGLVALPTSLWAQSVGSPSDFSQYFFDENTNQKVEFKEDEQKFINDMFSQALSRNRELMAAGCRNPKDLETKRKCYDLRSKPLNIDMRTLKKKRKGP